MFLRVYFDGVMVATYEVGRNWHLAHIRTEVSVTLRNVVPEEFRFRLQREGHPDVNINPRHEGSQTVAQVLPPWTFEIVAC